MNQVESSLISNVILKATTAELVPQYRDELNKLLSDRQSLLEAIQYLTSSCELKSIIKFKFLQNIITDHHKSIINFLLDEIKKFPDDLMLSFFFNHLSHEELGLKIKLYHAMMDEFEVRNSYVSWLKIYHWGKENSIYRSINIDFLYSVGDYLMILEVYVDEYIKAFSTKYISIIRIEKLISNFIILKDKKSKDFNIRAILNDLDVIEQIVLVQKTKFPIPFYAKKAQIIECILSVRIHPIFILSAIKFLYLANQEELIKDLIKTETLKEIDQEMIGRDLFYNDIIHQGLSVLLPNSELDDNSIDLNSDNEIGEEIKVRKKKNVTNYDDVTFRFKDWKNGLDICLIHKNYKQAIEIIDTYSNDLLEYKILKISLLIKMGNFDKVIALIDQVKSTSLEFIDQLEIMSLEAELLNSMGMTDEAKIIVKKLRQVDPYFQQLRARIDEN